MLLLKCNKKCTKRSLLALPQTPLHCRRSAPDFTPAVCAHNVSPGLKTASSVKKKQPKKQASSLLTSTRDNTQFSQLAPRLVLCLPSRTSRDRTPCCNRSFGLQPHYAKQKQKKNKIKQLDSRLDFAVSNLVVLSLQRKNIQCKFNGCFTGDDFSAICFQKYVKNSLYGDKVLASRLI